MDINHNFKQNIKGRDFIVGDLHGEYDFLMSSLKKMNFDFNNDRLFGVGDLIDRGPKSVECLLLLDEDWFFSTLGNHEDMMKDCVDERGNLVHHESLLLWMANGGKWYKSVKYKNYKFSISHLISLVNNIPLTLDIETTNGKVGIVHADFLYDTWDDLITSKKSLISIDSLIWGRRTINDFISSGNLKRSKSIDDLYAIFHGHTPLQTYQKVYNRYFIDTGACFKGMDTLTFIQIEPDIKSFIFEK